VRKTIASANAELCASGSVEIVEGLQRFLLHYTTSSSRLWSPPAFLHRPNQLASPRRGQTSSRLLPFAFRSTIAPHSNPSSCAMDQVKRVRSDIEPTSVEPCASPSLPSFAAAQSAAPISASSSVGRPPSDFALSVQQRDELLSQQKGSRLAPRQREPSESGSIEMSASPLQRDQ